MCDPGKWSALSDMLCVYYIYNIDTGMAPAWTTCGLIQPLQYVQLAAQWIQPIQCVQVAAQWIQPIQLECPCGCTVGTTYTVWPHLVGNNTFQKGGYMLM